MGESWLAIAELVTAVVMILLTSSFFYALAAFERGLRGLRKGNSEMQEHLADMKGSLDRLNLDLEVFEANLREMAENENGDLHHG